MGDFRWANVLVAPIWRQVILDTHDALGHTGRDKTREAIETIWWWPGLRTMVTEAIK